MILISEAADFKVVLIDVVDHEAICPNANHADLAQLATDAL